MSDSIMTAMVNGLSTLLGAVIGGGAVVLAQHLVSWREQEAKKVERMEREKREKNSRQVRHLLKLQDSLYK